MGWTLYFQTKAMETLGKLLRVYDWLTMEELNVQCPITPRLLTISPVCLSTFPGVMMSLDSFSEMWESACLITGSVTVTYTNIILMAVDPVQGYRSDSRAHFSGKQL